MLDDNLTISEINDLSELATYLCELLTFLEFKQAIGEDGWDRNYSFDSLYYSIRRDSDDELRVILDYLKKIYEGNKKYGDLRGKFDGKIKKIIKYAVQIHTTDRRAISQEQYSKIQEVLERLGVSLEPIKFKDKSRTAKHNELFDEMKLHPRIKQVSEELFKDEHYAQAILEAFKEVNNFVKEKSSSNVDANERLDGVRLMTKVFNKDNPIIALNALEQDWQKDEQEGYMHLYMGATLGIRNPKAHAFIVQEDPYKALKLLAFASL